MATNAGVWIDKKQAIVVLISKTGSVIKKFKSGSERAVPPAGPRSKKTYTPNDFIAEDRRERKLVGDRRKEYDEVIACLRGTKAVLIVGPGEAKSEFVKLIKSKKARGFTVEVATTDKLSDRQFAAKVSEHFSKSSAGKSVAGKKPVNAMTKKRPMKAKK